MRKESKHAYDGSMLISVDAPTSCFHGPKS